MGSSFSTDHPTEYRSLPNFFHLLQNHLVAAIILMPSKLDDMLPKLTNFALTYPHYLMDNTRGSFICYNVFWPGVQPVSHFNFATLSMTSVSDLVFLSLLEKSWS